MKLRLGLMVLNFTWSLDMTLHQVDAQGSIQLMGMIATSQDVTWQSISDSSCLKKKAVYCSQQRI